MASNYTLKYRTFDQLLSDVMVDFKKYQSRGLIDNQELIKVARRCNYELGLRIYKTKEEVLDVFKGRVKLPNDFYVFNFALVLKERTVEGLYPTGVHTEDVLVGSIAQKIHVTPPPEEIDLCHDLVPYEERIDPLCNCGCKTDCHCQEQKCEDDKKNDCCLNPGTCRVVCNGDVYQLRQYFNGYRHTYKSIFPLNILESTEDFNGFCPGMYWESPMSGYIKDGWLYTSFDDGKVYINYQGDMEDEEGHLLVPDHEVLNEFYEYALKQRIIENLIMNDEEVNPNKLQLIESRYKAYRNNAFSIVNTPNFNELREMFRSMRNKFRNRFVNMFSSYPVKVIRHGTR